MRKHLEQAIILENVQLTETSYLMILQSPVIARNARPGQFVMLRVDSSFDPFLRRPFSLFGIDRNEGIIEIVYRVVGRGTRLLRSKRKGGESLDLVGPLGNGFSLPPQNFGTVWFVAGGIGIAALVSCIEEVRLRQPKTQRILFYGEKTQEEFIPNTYFTKSCHKVYYATDDGSLGFHGTVLDCIQDHIKKDPTIPSHVFACGPIAMLKNTASWVIDNKIPAQFCLESVMGCGIGACLGCALPGHVDYGSGPTRFVHVCFEGPVFSPEAIKWKDL